MFFVVLINLICVGPGGKETESRLRRVSQIPERGTAISTDMCTNRSPSLFCLVSLNSERTTVKSYFS